MITLRSLLKSGASPAKSRTKSHSTAAKLLAACDRGFFDDLVTPFQAWKDNLAREPDMDKLAKLKPAFDKKSGKGTLTAANSSTLTGELHLVYCWRLKVGEEHNLPVRAYLSFYETAAVDFFGKDGNKEKEGLLMLSAYAVPRMLDRAGLTLQDFDFYEIHEAFAGVVLSTLKAWEDEVLQERLGRDKPLGTIAAAS